MQGRPGQGREPGDRPSGRRIASLNGTGKQRSLPQRPPRMARVNQPPTKPRVARPSRETPEAGKSRKKLLIIGGILVVCALLACFGSYAVYNVINGINASNGAATAATNFLSAVSNQDYNQAYQYLGPAVTLSLQKEQFAQQGQTADRCYGVVKDYKEVPDSATSQGNNQSYSYTITREKLNKTYQMRLTLQQDQYNQATWKITDYGGDLGPGQSAPACK
jgi:hypothetical protein